MFGNVPTTQLGNTIYEESDVFVTISNYPVRVRLLGRVEIFFVFMNGKRESWIGVGWRFEKVNRAEEYNLTVYLGLYKENETKEKFQIYTKTIR